MAASSSSKGNLDAVRPTAPGSRGFAWGKAPRATQKAPPLRDPGTDKYNDNTDKTTAVDVELSPRRFATSFSSEQLRLSQMRRPCHAELYTPVPWKIETEEVGPGTYGNAPVEVEQKNSSFFRSTTPAASPSPLFADATRTSAFFRSRAEILGPGSYEPPAPAWSRRSKRESSAFASGRPQRQPMPRLLTAHLDTPPVFVIRSAPSTGGYSFSRKSRTTQVVAARDAGRDVFNDSSSRSIGWSIANGSGLRVG